MSRGEISINQRRENLHFEGELHRFGTVSRTEEIESEIERIRSVWRKGYNFRTRKIYQLEPLLEGLILLDNFINEYWNDFSADEKIRLVTQANLLKQVSDPKYYTNLRNLLNVIFSQRFLITIRLIFKYMINIYKNPKNHLFIQLNNANQMVAEVIIEKVKKDLKLANLRKFNLERVNTRWKEQGELLVNDLDREVEIGKTNEDLEWEEHLAVSHKYIARQAFLFDALSKEYLLPYKNQYVFFEEGEVKDHDNSREDLIDRVYQTTGYRAIYVTKVELEN